MNNSNNFLSPLFAQITGDELSSLVGGVGGLVASVCLLVLVVIFIVGWLSLPFTLKKILKEAKRTNALLEENNNLLTRQQGNKSGNTR